MKPTINTKWFQQRLADKDLTQRDLAKAMGIAFSAISRTLRGTRRMQLTEAVTLAQALGVPLESVLDAAGLDSPADLRATVPVVGQVDARGTIHGKALEGPRKAERPAGAPDGTSAIRLAAPASMAGWLAYYVQSDIVDPEAVGRLSVIRTATKGVLLGVLTRSFESGKWRVTSLDGTPLDGLRIASACPVTWLKT